MSSHHRDTAKSLLERGWCHGGSPVGHVRFGDDITAAGMTMAATR
jgi:hypothetical protein